MTLQVHENKNDPFEKVSPLFLREFYFIISIFMFNPETPEVGKHVPLVLGYQLTLFGPKGADYACYITAPPHLFGRCGVSDIHLSTDNRSQFYDALIKFS